MIAVDTSALLAILFGEADGPACREALATEADLIISASTLAEAYVVARGRGVLVHLADLLDAIPMAVIPVDGDTAARVSAKSSVLTRSITACRILLPCRGATAVSLNGFPIRIVSRTPLRSIFSGR